MSVVSMQKITIFVHSKIINSLLNELQKKAAIHIIKVEKKDTFKNNNIEKLKQKIQNLEETINFLSTFTSGKNFLQTLVDTKIFVSHKEFNNIIVNFNAKNIITKSDESKRKLQSLNQEEQQLKTLLSELLPWEKMEIPFFKLKETKYTETILTKISNVKIEILEEELQNYFFNVINEIGNDKYIFLIFLKEDKIKLFDILKKYNFVQTKFTSLNNLPIIEIENIKEQLQQITKQKENIYKECTNFVQDINKLMVFVDYYNEILKRIEVKENFIETKTTIMIEGWIKKQNIENVKKEFTHKFKEVEIITSQPQDDEIPPVEMENKKIVQPFEVITNLYGKPLYSEIDPTPFLAPFFAICFGLCLTDAGYGLILILLATFLLKKMKLNKGGIRFLNLLRIIGTTTIFVGILTGSIFGLQFKEVPTCFIWFVRLREKLMLFDPLQQPLLFFGIAMGLGYIHVCLGILIEFFEYIRKRQILDGIINQLTWFLLISNLIVLLAPNFGITLPCILVIISKFFVLTCVFVILFYKGRYHKNIFKRLLVGAYALYGIVSGTLADIVSYSRLLALGLASGIIAMVVNIMAGLFLKVFSVETSMFLKIPIILFGSLFYLIVLIGGHIGNLLINSLGGFIHTTRLQFVEFFTKFYEGGGEEFSPFSIKGKYTIYKE